MQPEEDLEKKKTEGDPPEQDFNPVKAIIIVIQSMVVLKVGIVHFGSNMAAEPEFWNIAGFVGCILWTIGSFTFFILRPK